MDRTHCRGVIPFHVPGVPVGKGRPRFTRTGRTYTPAKTREWERQVAKVADEAMHGIDMLKGPLKATLVFYLPIPKSWSKRRRQEADGAPAITRVDADNLAKAVLDACNGIVYEDDKQVTELDVVKQYVLDGGTVDVGVTMGEIG